MKHVFMLVVVLFAVAAQQAPDESNLPDVEKRIPPFHYCKHEGVAIGPKETRAHSCSCKMVCRTDEGGNLVEAESSDCLAYCKVNGRRCTCHVEEPCPDGVQAGIADDDPVVVAPRNAELMPAPVSNFPTHTAERNERINGQPVRLQQVDGRWRAVSSRAR